MAYMFASLALRIVEEGHRYLAEIIQTLIREEHHDRLD
jgi:hypothetical protein